MDLSKSSMRGWVAVVLCGGLWFAACTEQKANEPATSDSASRSATRTAEEPAEPPRVDAATRVPPEKLAKLDDQHGEVSERIGKLGEDTEAADSKTVQELDDERSRISKELEALGTAAGEQWQSVRDWLEKALQPLRERLDRLEKSESLS